LEIGRGAASRECGGTLMRSSFCWAAPHRAIIFSIMKRSLWDAVEDQKRGERTPAPSPLHCRALMPLPPGRWAKMRCVNYSSFARPHS
jgi:hypothetical protein